MTRYELTNHARESLRKRPTIKMEWIERVIENPERVEPDALDPALEHHLGRIREYEGRVLRVIVSKRPTPVRIITCYFDHTRRRKL